MDPLLSRLGALAPSRGRLLGAVVAVGLLVVLAVSVLIAALQSAGSGAVYRAVPSARSTPVPSPTPTSVLVQVVGAVRQPGLVSVPAGARAVDAVAAAGGPTAKADESAVNLAGRVVDGQQLVVPERNRSRGSAVPPAPVGASGSGPVSLSTASLEQLQTLPRIGPAMAARIVAWREANGGFRSVDDLLKVSGIGARTLAGLKDLVTP